ncbi:metalloreductase STEAP2 isoform 2-T7 [Hipposideros larvatus]
MESISMMGSPKNLSETFLPNGINGIKDARKVTVGVIGSGDFAKSLTIRLIRCGYHVVIGSRNPKFASEFFPHVVDVTHHEDALTKTNIIFVAIHREHYTSLWDLRHLLVGKVLIDVSNNMRINQYPESNAEYLASLFPDSLIVKGFNVVSAWALQLGPKDASRQVYICSNNIQARQQVIELARQLNFIPVDLGSLSSAREIENLPLRLFTLWRGPVVVAISLATFFFLYSFVRDVIHPYARNQQSDFYKIPIEIVNKTLPIVAITLLSLVYLAGLLAAAYQLYYGTKYRRFPPWLETWLQCRKQLGLLSFFFASVHVAYSLCLPMRRSERYLFLNMAYQQVHANIENSWNEEEVWRIEMYISFGIMSLGLLSLLAVTSIPSVSNALNWREFSFIQSTLGYVALLISTFHVLIYGWKRAFEEEYYRFYTPPNFVLALVLPSVVILGDLMKVPSSELRIQICKCIVDFYHAEPPKKHITGYQQASSSFKIQMAEGSGLAKAMVQSLALLENQLVEKLWVLKALQHLSTSEVNCTLMMEAHAASGLCAHLNDPDPSGQLLFRSSEILWNLLEKSSKEEIIQQLSSLECLLALKEVFKNLFMRGFSHYDRQLRNDILVITTIIAQNPEAPMIECGFTRDLILFATFTEVKSQNPLVKDLKLSNSYEDFELKKLLFNIIVILCKDLPNVQLLIDGNVVLALFTYVKKPEKHKIIEWSVAQYEELQLHAIATLSSVAPLLIEEYMLCQGNARILAFLKWCESEDSFMIHGNSFHGTGGRGNKLAHMRYTLRLLRAMVSLEDETVNTDLCETGTIQQLIGIFKNTISKSNDKEEAIVLEIQSDILLISSGLCEHSVPRKEIFGTEGVDIILHVMKTDPKKFQSGLGYNVLLFSTLDSIWCCILGCYTLEDYFLEKEGIFLLLDLLALKQKKFCNLILGIMVEFCDNPKTTAHVNAWRGKKDQTAASLLIKLWRKEEKELGVKRDKHGKIMDTKKPLFTNFQEEQKIIPLPANCPTIAVMDVAENIRAKIYAVLGKLDFENLPGLSTEDFVTLCIIHRYLDFKIGEIWNEIYEEIKLESLRPIATDKHILEAITAASENIGKMVASLQSEIIETQARQDVQNEQKVYTKIQASHKQRELANKSWENFLARTSNARTLKKAKRLQEKAIESSRYNERPPNAIFHQTVIKGFNTTVPSGQVVTLESTPARLIGGPLADTDIAIKKLPIRGGALQRVKAVKTVGEPKKSVPT